MTLSQTKKYSLIPNRWKKFLLLVILDLFSVFLAYTVTLWIRFDCCLSAIPEDYSNVFQSSIAVVAVLSIVVYYAAHLYWREWRLASYHELVSSVACVVLFILAHWILLPVLVGNMPKSYFLFGGLLQLFLLLLTRFSYRIMHLCSRGYSMTHTEGPGLNAMVIGGGATAQIIIRELNTSDHSKVFVRCIIDDDPDKLNSRLEGVTIVGNRDVILQKAKEYNIQRIYFAIPSISQEERTAILNICSETNAEVLTLPGIYQLTERQFSISQMKKVTPEDLLGRPPIKVDNQEILEALRGKVILVTGGGGSIGSELCRQIAEHSPKMLIIFDVYENNAYDIQQELVQKYGNALNLRVLIGSVRDTLRINRVFEQFKPEIVFHAAAHKHVPLMEESPCEAIKNNALGTYKTACAAIANGTRRFVLISTDKAVNPTNVMGASKRLCEIIVQTMDKLCAEGRLSLLPKIQMHLQRTWNEIPHDITSPLPQGQRTEFVAVRFGNVLGSNGSVIPLFKKQIEKGGPVTVTHPDVIRFFMTIPEAVSLVLQAEAYAKGGEIFVFDMGNPVKIDTLARNLITLMGYVPGRDIKVTYSGLRPGEKLYEERLMDTEGLEKTPNKLISIAYPVIPAPEIFLSQLFDLAQAAYNNTDEMKKIVSQVITTYQYPPPSENEQANNKK